MYTPSVIFVFPRRRCACVAGAFYVFDPCTQIVRALPSDNCSRNRHIPVIHAIRSVGGVFFFFFVDDSDLHEDIRIFHNFFLFSAFRVAFVRFEFQPWTTPTKEPHKPFLSVFPRLKCDDKGKRNFFKIFLFTARCLHTSFCFVVKSSNSTRDP